MEDDDNNNYPSQVGKKVSRQGFILLINTYIASSIMVWRIDDCIS